MLAPDCDIAQGSEPYESVMSEGRDPTDPPISCRNQSQPLTQLIPVVAGVVVVALALGMDIPLCPTAGLLGIPCPSCGLTRATAALLSGDLRRALVIHPAVLLVLTYLGIAASVFFRRPSTRTRSIVNVLGLMLVVCLVLLWGARFAGAFGGPATVERW